MANKKSFVRILKDLATGAGESLTKAVEGLAAATQRGLTAFVAKDVSGNIQLLNLNSDGAVRVSLGDDEDNWADLDSGPLNNAGSLSEVEVGAITLQASTEYKKPFVNVSCYQDTIYRLVSVDDAEGTPVEDELLVWKAAEGQNDISKALDRIKFTSGSTGVQELQLLATNIEEISEIDALIGVMEKQ